MFAEKGAMNPMHAYISDYSSAFLHSSVRGCSLDPFAMINAIFGQSKQLREAIVKTSSQAPSYASESETTTDSLTR